MKNWEERIKEIEKAAEDIERLSKARSAGDKEDTVRLLAAKNAIGQVARQLSVALKHDAMGSIPVSARHVFSLPSVFLHSTLGTARSISSDFDYYQTSASDIRGGQRFMDRFAKRFVGTNETTRRIRVYPTGQADDVAEGALKPQRSYTFTAADYEFRKLAVTDTITQEVVLADKGEKAANFIIDALFEHVKDVLNQRLIAYLTSNGTAFDPALFAGVLNIPSGTARWHDLLALAQVQFERTFADHFLDIKYGNILLVPYNIYGGIVQDRKGAGFDLYYEPDLLGNLSLQNIWKDYSGRIMILTHTEALTIELVDDVQIYYNRVADANEERNLYRVTVEVYYRFVPSKDPLPAIVSLEPVTDLAAIAP
jgi:hypothetical protein